MSADEQRHSLADDAAAWVPPWERATAAREPELEVEPEPDAELEPERVPELEPEPDAEVAPDRAPELEPEPDAEVEPDGEPEPAFELEVAPDPELEPEPDLEPEVAPEPQPVAIEPDPMPEPDPEPPVPLPEPLPEPEPPMESIVDPAQLRGALEAILLVVDEPVTEIMLAQVLEQPAVEVAAALTELAEEYTRTGRGFELRRVAGGWRLYTRGDYASYVEKFVLDGQQVRLTQAALETLAVVAYKQPVTRSRISAIRGVNSDGVIRTLVSRGLVEECGSEPDSGAHLYRTTILFLEKLGLDNVDQLPPLAPFLPDNVDEISDVPTR